jgi:hypothetical protein
MTNVELAWTPKTPPQTRAEIGDARKASHEALIGIGIYLSLLR